MEAPDSGELLHQSESFVQDLGPLPGRRGEALIIAELTVLLGCVRTRAKVEFVYYLEGEGVHSLDAAVVFRMFKAEAADLCVHPADQPEHFGSSWAVGPNNDLLVGATGGRTRAYLFRNAACQGTRRVATIPGATGLGTSGAGRRWEHGSLAYW